MAQLFRALRASLGQASTHQAPHLASSHDQPGEFEVIADYYIQQWKLRNVHWIYILVYTQRVIWTERMIKMESKQKTVSVCLDAIKNK